MPKGHHLNRDDLDAAFPDNPVLVDARLDARRRAQFALPRRSMASPQTPDAAGRGNRAQAGYERALWPDHGDGVSADHLGAAHPRREQEIEWSRKGGRCCTRQPVSPRPRKAPPTRRTSSHETRVGCRRQHHRHRRLSFHHRPGQDLASTRRQSGASTRTALSRRRQDHDRWFAPGQDGLLHHALSEGGPGGEKNWSGELTFPQDTVNRW